MAEITSAQKKLIRKLISGLTLSVYRSQIVGRDPTTTYDLSDGTTVKKETVQPLITEGILERKNSNSSVGFGYQNRTYELTLTEKYQKDFAKHMKGKK